MPLTAEQQAHQEMVIYGIPKSEIDLQWTIVLEVTEDLYPASWRERAGVKDNYAKTSIVVSMLSDVQELINMGEDEEARTLINRVKHIVMEKL